MNILLLRDRFPHMGRYSGYDQLGEALSRQPGANRIKSVWRPRRVRYSLLLRKIRQMFQGRMHTTPFYDLPSLWTELKAAWSAYWNPTDLIHVLYLEDTLGLLPYLRQRYFPRVRLIATAHQPRVWWKINQINPSWLNSLDALIVLDDASREYFSCFVNPDRIHVVPHGVRSDFFYPAPSDRPSPSPLRCLFVGQWLRDIDCFGKVVDLVTKLRPDVQFDMVTKWNARAIFRASHIRLAQRPNVQFHSSLTDEQLLDLYRNGTLLTLPLLDSTANNALLEAMSTGLPIVTSPAGGVPDYLSPGLCTFVESSEPSAWADAILTLLQHPQIREQQAAMARKKVEDVYDWSLVAAQVMRLYQKTAVRP